MITQYKSPVGLLTLAATDAGLAMCDWPDSRRYIAHLAKIQSIASSSPQASAILQAAMAELDEYFAGQRRQFATPLAPIATPFAAQVHAELCRLPYGQTITYKGLSMRLGNAGAVRAVANACADNMLSIFIPCHRVVGSRGALIGYAGGLEAKRRLLQLERL